MKVALYICSEREVETPIPRHYLPPISLCRELGMRDLDEIAQHLSKELLEELKRRGEIRVTDYSVIEKIVGTFEKPGYLRIVAVRLP